MERGGENLLLVLPLVAEKIPEASWKPESKLYCRSIFLCVLAERRLDFPCTFHFSM